jgi:hypothetical protein
MVKKADQKIKELYLIVVEFGFGFVLEQHFVDLKMLNFKKENQRILIF